MKISRRSFIEGASAAVLCAGLTRGAYGADALTLNDASRLSETVVSDHITLSRPSSQDLVARIRQELKRAVAEKRSIVASVARHSMGGQSLALKGTCITLDGAPIELDTAARTYRIGAGARWRDVIAALDPVGFSPTVMQSNADFGVGSTFCVNAHGWPTPHGPFGSTVRSVRMILADGSLVNCSRTENVDLFRLAMGGYGMFGVIVELDVDMVPNALLEPSFETMPAERFADAFTRAVEATPSVNMAYGRLAVARDNFFNEALLVTYKPAAQQPSPLPAAASSGFMTGIQRNVYRIQTGHEWAKRARWFVESRVSPRYLASAATRNTLMDEPVANLADSDASRTDILHEYFVSPERFPEFLVVCRDIIPKAKAEFLNVTLRYVATDQTAVLAYAPQKRIAAVMSFSQEISAAGEADMKQMTEALIERIVSIGGAFYLPYRLHARRDQLERAYTNVAHFVSEKRRLDPQSLFSNTMWEHYFA